MGISILSPLSPSVTFLGVTVLGEENSIYLYEIYIDIYSILSSFLYCHHCHLVFSLFISIFNLFPVVIGLVGFWLFFSLFLPLLGGDSGDSSKKWRFGHINTGKKLSPTFSDRKVTKVTKVTGFGGSCGACRGESNV